MPLEQVSNNLTFYSFFTYAKQGVAGLTVTADVYRSGTSILTAQACTAVGGGLYSYTLSSANVTVEGEYICLFKTTSTSVDQQHIPAIWCIAKAGVEYLDAQVTSRAAIVDYTTARAAKLDNLDATISSRLAPAGITSMQADVTAIKTPVTTNLDATISSRLTPAGITSMQVDVTEIKTPVTTNLDATISSRLAPAGITNMQADITAIKTPVTTNLDATISSRLTPAGITSLQSDVTAIKTPIIANIDTTISSRLATTGITGLQADITTIGSDIVTIKPVIIGNIDVPVSTRLADADYVLPNNAGKGSITYTVVVTRPDTTTPIEGCATWVSSDSSGANIIAGTVYTDTLGKATYMLDAGTYYLWRQIAGWNFTNPTSFTVS